MCIPAYLVGVTAAVTVWLIDPLVCIVYSLIPCKMFVAKVLSEDYCDSCVFKLFVLTTATMVKWHCLQAEYMYGNVADTLKRQRHRSEKNI